MPMRSSCRAVGCNSRPDSNGVCATHGGKPRRSGYKLRKLTEEQIAAIARHVEEPPRYGALTELAERLGLPRQVVNSRLSTMRRKRGISIRHGDYSWLDVD